MTTEVPEGLIVVADTMVALTGPNRFEHRGTVEAPDGSRHPAIYALKYRRKGETLTFLPDPCPNPVSGECFYTDRTGRLNGDDLTLTFIDVAQRVRVYSRLR